MRLILARAAVQRNSRVVTEHSKGFSLEQERFLVLVLLLLSFVLRFWQVSRLPIFIDEAIYLSWGQAILLNFDLRTLLHPLSDGKQPLFIWLVAIALRVLDDPLTAGRAVASLAGVVSTALVYVISRSLYSQKTAVLAALLYVVCPFTLFFDRLAVMEPLLSMFGLLALLFTIHTVRTRQLRNALLLGFALGLAFFTKTTAVLYLLYPVLAFLLVSDSVIFVKKTLIQVLFLLAVSAVAPLGVSLVLAHVGASDNIARQDRTVILPLSTFLTSPLTDFIPMWRRNLELILNWMNNILGTVVLVLFGMAIIIALIKRRKPELFLALLFVLPNLIVVLGAHYFHYRHLVFTIPPLLMVTAQLISQLGEMPVSAFRRIIGSQFQMSHSLGLKLNYVLPLALILPVIGVYAYQDVQMIRDPLEVGVSKEFAGWWISGDGITEVVDVLRREAGETGLRVLAEGFGLPNEALQVYFRNSPSFEIRRVSWEHPLMVGPGKPAFAVLNIPANVVEQFRIAYPSAQLIFVHNKSVGDSRFEVYRLPIEEGRERPSYYQNGPYQQVISKGYTYALYELERTGPVESGRGDWSLPHLDASGHAVWSLYGPEPGTGYTLFDVPWGGDYSVFVRAGRGPSDAFRPFAKLDDAEWQLIGPANVDGLVWYKMGRIRLAQGWHKLQFKINGLDILAADAILWTDDPDYFPPNVKTVEVLTELILP